MSRSRRSDKKGGRPNRAGARARSRALRLPALEVRQTENRTLYSFAVDGKLIRSFAAISRVRRDTSNVIAGYQRSEALGHISQIRRYIESKDPLLPNAIVLAFDDRVRFQPARGRRKGEVRHGTLIVPHDPSWDEVDKPAWVVDGQQRLAAVEDAAIDGFPMCAVGFIAESDSDQREQFMLVNSTKPLPKGLLYELLPSVTGRLPVALQNRKLPAQIAERLNFADRSPFSAMIQTATNPEGCIKDNSILRMLENSLSDGVLYWFTGGRGGPDIESILNILTEYWSAVRSVFSQAWGLPPRRSRLMHGAGIVSMGMLMDTICAGYRSQGFPDRAGFECEIGAVASVCHWTSGYWQLRNGERRKWNEVQNTSRDIQLLSDHLREEYKARVWRASRTG